VDEQATLQDALNITDSLGVQTLRLKINSRIKEIHQLIQEEEMVSSVELKCDTCQPELSSYHAPSSIRLESDFRIMEQCAAVTL
jgi:hypothetical protein